MFMDRELLFWLLIPLLVLAAISAFLHTQFEWDGFFGNLTTELIGIIVTVAYVDWVIRRHEAKQWREAEERVLSRLQDFINTSIAAIRVSLGYGTDIFDYTKFESKDSILMRSELIRVAKEVLEPTAKWRIESLDAKAWQSFIQHLQFIWEAADRLITTFGNKLKPTQYALLLDIQDTGNYILQLYNVRPDVPGVPDGDLPPSTKFSPSVIKQSLNDHTTRDLRSMLHMLRELADTL